MSSKKPEIRIYAGPNGSGKSTITSPSDVIHPYINVDDIQRRRNIDNLGAAQIATAMREECVEQKVSFTSETVLSTERNLILLEHAKQMGFFIRCAFVLTIDPAVNVLRVQSRVADGGHDVPAEKIVSRYYKALSLIPRLLLVCDRLNIYDNTLDGPIHIFKKRDDVYEVFDNPVWSHDEILRLITLGHN